MATKNKKKNKFLWLSIFLIIVIIIVSIIIHFKINKDFLTKNTKTLFNEYKQDIIESVSPKEGEKTSDSKVTNDETSQILELQNKIKELQQKIETSSSISNNYVKNIQFVVYTNLFVYKLLSGNPFPTEIDYVTNYTTNPILKDKLNKLKKYSTIGIKNKEELIKNYQTVYKDTYLQYLRNKKSTFSKIKSYLLYIIFIKKNNEEILEGSSIPSVLSNVEVYMKEDNFKMAYDEFIKLNITPSSNTQQWLSDMLEKIEAEDVINQLNLEISKYINIEGK